MRSAVTLGVSVIATSIAFGFACGAPRLPAPQYSPQPTSALVEVPYPPPPARTETVSATPAGAAVWIDGEWSWQVRRWSWKAGRWVVPPAGATYSPWTAVRDRDGTLFVAAGAWRNASGVEVEEPQVAASRSPEARDASAEDASLPDASNGDAGRGSMGDASDLPEAGP